MSLNLAFRVSSLNHLYTLFKRFAPIYQKNFRVKKSTIYYRKNTEKRYGDDPFKSSYYQQKNKAHQTAALFDVLIFKVDNMPQRKGSSMKCYYSEFPVLFPVPR
jgi:hypothetical protein